MTDPGQRTSPAIRALAIASWTTILVVLLRIVSGGGSLRGVGYVLETEPRVVVAIGALVLVGGLVAISGLLLDAAWAWRASGAASAIALAAGLVLLAGGHDSAWLVVLAAALGLVLTVRAGTAASGPSR